MKTYIALTWRTHTPCLLDRTFYFWHGDNCSLCIKI